MLRIVSLRIKNISSFIILSSFLAYMNVSPVFAKDCISSNGESSSNSCTSLQPPPWPLQPLTKVDRVERLKYFFRTQSYVSDDDVSSLEQETCKKLISDIENNNKFNILEPDIVVESRDDPNVPDNLISRCSTVEFDRIWFSWKKGWLKAGVDSDFDALPLKEKDSFADFYHKKTGQIEFYDVKRYFGGKPTWASFVEDGALVCNRDNRLCSELEGYRLISGIVVGPVIDSKTCSVYASSKVKVGERLRTRTSKPYSYQEMPTFYAYIEIDEKLYRLGMTIPVTWNELHRFNNDEGASTLILETTDKTGGFCKYISTNKRKNK